MSAADRVAARRQKLLEAGLDLFGTKGYAATGVKDLCGQAGLTDRYFYESFRSRDELFVAIFDRLTAELFESVVAALAAAEPKPEVQARAGVEALVRPLAEDPRKPRVLFVEAAAIGGDTEQHARASLRRFSSLIAATAQRHLPADVPEELVRMGALSLVGAIALLLIEWQQGSLGVSGDQVVDYSVRLFFAAGSLYGITPPPISGRFVAGKD